MSNDINLASPLGTGGGSMLSIRVSSGAGFSMAGMARMSQDALSQLLKRQQDELSELEADAAAARAKVQDTEKALAEVTAWLQLNAR